ncbi:MAG: NRDE family protein [Pseudomonadota bacterium]
MCLIALAIDQHRRFPLVLASNRDEFFSRPTARLSWWQPEDSAVPLLAGRDLLQGGTWLGLSAQGRLAVVTNVRQGLPSDPKAPSRGHIVPQWLAQRESADRFWMHTALSGHNGFNLLALDFKENHCFWTSNLSAHPLRLARGLHALSNGMMDDAPWPKVTRLKRALKQALDGCDPHTSVDGLADTLFAALADRQVAPDEALPETGLSLLRERELSAAFVRTADGTYGTRSSTLVITERVQRRLVTHVLERSFSAQSGVVLVRRSQLKHWPPRPTDPSSAPEAVSESPSVPPSEAPGEPTTAVKRQRMRRLLRPG